MAIFNSYVKLPEGISPQKMGLQMATAYGAALVSIRPRSRLGKKKLLQKQAAGKKRMQAIGKVNVPSEAW